MKNTTFLIIYILVAIASVDSINAANPPYYEVTYQPSTKEGALQIGVAHTLWIPENVKTVRGIIIHQHGCGVGSCRSGETAAYDLHWQALARKWDCALLGPSYKQAKEQNCRLWCDPRNGSGKVLIESLATLAKVSGREEIASAPWCIWGHSGGGFWASLMQMSHPERIVAIWFQSGTAFGYWEKGEIETPSIPDAAMGIPMMANPGLKERDHVRFKNAWNGSLAMFKAYRAKGATIAFTPDPKTGHDTGDSRYLAIPFFDVSLSMRLPDKSGDPLNPVDQSRAWLCDINGGYPVSAANFGGDKNKANWLPNEAYAKAWHEFIQTGAVADRTPPPSPSSIRKSKSAKGFEITWKTRADFESGVQSFIVLRDGKEIGRVPDKLSKKPYRNLFQGKTYGDTPVAPLPKMRFFDPDGNADSKYQIVTINSVGLQSKD